MVIRMNNVHSYGNGGDGFRFGAGTDVEATNIHSHGNLGHGMSSDQSANINIDGGDFSGNGKSGIHIFKTDDGVNLEVSDAHRRELVDIFTSAANLQDRDDKLSRSGVGRWLQGQKLTDWIKIAVDLYKAATSG